jgi:Holliday junction resolvase RusA-like endonuclease
VVEVVFTVPGAPRGKERPRATRQGRVYTPEKTVNAEALIKLLAGDAMNGRPLLEGALEMLVEFVLPIPASFSKIKRAQAIAGTLAPLSKPDIDNGAKLVADALNGVVYKDDAAIVRMALVKRYGEVPATIVEVREMPPERVAFYSRLCNLLGEIPELVGSFDV